MRETCRKGFHLLKTFTSLDQFICRKRFFGREQLCKMVEIGEKKIPAPRECPLSQSSRGAGIFLPLSVDSCNDFSPKEAARIYGLENVALRKFFFSLDTYLFFCLKSDITLKAKQSLFSKKKRKKKDHKHKCGGAVISKILKAMLINIRFRNCL